MPTLQFDWITIPSGNCWIGSDPAQDELADAALPGMATRRLTAIL